MDRGIDEKKSKPPSIRLAKDPPGFQKNLPRILRVGGASGVGGWGGGQERQGGGATPKAKTK